MNRIIGINIKEARIARNLSQEKVASDLSYSQATWSKIENGKVSLKAGELYKLACYFDISMEEFFKEKGFKKDNILFNLIQNGINFIVADKKIIGEKMSIENLIFLILKDPKDSRYIECLPFLIYKNISKINLNEVLEKCYVEKIQNRLGFIFEILIKLKRVNEKLKKIYKKICDLKIKKEDSFFFEKEIYKDLEPIIPSYIKRWFLYDRFNLDSFGRHFI